MSFDFSFITPDFAQMKKTVATGVNLGSAAGGVSPLIRLRRLPTSGLPYERPRATRALYERPRATRALWWGAPQAADPPTPGPEKHQKSFRRVGESFLAGIRVAHKHLQEHNPPPILRVPKIGKKCRFDTFFGRFFSFSKLVFCGSHAKTQKML